MRKPDSRFVLAALGDLHLSERPPLARSGEKDWPAVQAGYLSQVEKILAYYGNPPLVIAGDVFDDGWRPGRCSPALINFAIQHLPVAYAIPGQHDLPHHRYADIRRSAYWTLVEAGKIVNLEPDKPRLCRNGVVLHGFPWGFPVRPLPEKYTNGLNVAVVHEYVYNDEGYPDAPKEQFVTGYIPKFRGYDAAVVGDNHKPWRLVVGQCRVRNGGTFIRRKADEVDYRPSVGLLDSDGYWSTHYLDTSADEFSHILNVDGQYKHRFADAGELVEALEGMGEVDPDFADACRRYMEVNATPEPVRDRVTKLLETLP